MKTVATLASLLLVNALAQDQTPANPPADPQTPADPPATGDDPTQDPTQDPAQDPAQDPDQDPDQTPADPPAGADAVLSALDDAGLTSLAKALADEAQADVVQALLDDDDGWTLFAPANGPLDAAASDITDPADLTPIFQYHASASPFDPKEADFPAVVETLLEAENLGTNQVVIVMQDGDTITVKSGAADDYTVDDTVQLDGNWVHAISGVLLPPEAPSKVATANQDLSTLVSALTDLELVDTIDGLSDITIFAPNNDAFGQGANATEDILTYHIVTEALYSPNIEAGKYATQSGKSLEIQVGDDGAVTLVDGSDNTITVTETDYLTNNGVIHIIDTVLTPSDQDAPADDTDDDGTGVAGSAAALQISFAAVLCLLALL